MKKFSKLTRFFIICGIVFLVGLVLLIAGLLAGGHRDLGKVAGRYDWIQDSPGERGITTQNVGDFHSIEATGDGDLWIVGKNYYENSKWLSDENLLGPTEQDVAGSNQVIIICGDKLAQPKVTVEDGVLKIDSGNYEFSGINFNFSDTDYYPRVLVCVPDTELKSLSVNGQIGDVDILGVSWEKANLKLDSGDINMKDVNSKELEAITKTGDVNVQGAFAGSSMAISRTGDINMDTSNIRSEYGYELKSDTGDILILEDGNIDEEFEDQGKVSAKGGPNTINAQTNTGDIILHFSGKEEAF